MSWLRRRGIETFRQHNPSWDVRVIGTPKNIDEREFSRDLPKKGDWTGWRMLKRHGGFVMHSDAVYVRPMRDEWLEYDLCAQLTGMFVHQIPAFGAAPRNKLMLTADKICENRPDNNFYNYGTDVLNYAIGRCQQGIEEYGNVFDLSYKVFCPYGWTNTNVKRMWTKRGPLAKEHTEETVGIHWYAGNQYSQKNERSAHSGGPSWIERIATLGKLP